jgi:adhesin transport system outer membrane protein
LTTAVGLVALFCPTSSWADQDPPVYGPIDENAKPSAEEVFVPKGIPNALVDAVALASREHPLVQQALANRRARVAQLKGARWLQFPSLSVEGLAVTQGNQIGAQDGLAANIIVEQPLYSFGRIGGTIEAADAALVTSTNGVIDAQVEILLRTVAAYYDLALATEREAILKDSLGQHNELLETISRRVTQEVSPQADLDLASSRVAQIEQDLAAVAGARSTAYSRLQELVGYAAINFGTIPRLDPEIELPTEESLVSAALECSPLLKGLRSTVREREAQRRVARSRLFPQIVAQGSQNEILGARIGLALRLQTGNGLSQLSAVDSAKADILSAEFETATAEREIREQIKVDYLTFVAGRNRVTASARASSTSDLVTESYKRQFIAGRRTWLDVMNAVRESMAASLTESDAELSALAAYSRLMARSCNWRTPPLVEIEE